METSSSANAVLDREFLTIRGRFLEIAAAMDRVERAGGAFAQDARWRQLEAAAAALAAGPNRAETLQMLFSLPYAENWRDAMFDAKEARP